MDKATLPCRVAQIEGEWILLGGFWVCRDDVMDADEVLAYYTKQVEQDSENAWAWLGRGTCERIEATSKGRSAIISAVPLDQGDGHACEQLADAY